MSVDAEAPLDRSASTLAHELSARIRGDVRADPFALSMYATDSSIYEIEPLLVVYPLDEDDVRTCLWFASSNKLPIIARGAGTGTAGESLGRAIVMDLNVHMARIIELDRQNHTVVVESGVVLDSLNRALKPHGFRIGPNPYSSPCCTIGGMIATNAYGPRSLQFGDMRANLVSARVVLSDGTVTNFRPIPVEGPVHERKKNEKGLAGKINRELPELLKQQAALIAAKKSKAEHDRCGYRLDGVLDEGVFDPSLLLCGSEGTLAVITEAVLKVLPLPEASGLSLIHFDSLPAAIQALSTIRATRPVACELLDGRLIALALQVRPDLGDVLHPDAQALLAVEYEASTEELLVEKLKALQEGLDGAGVKYRSIRALAEESSQTAFWDARRGAMPQLYYREDGLQPVPVVEDACVPLAKLPQFVEQALQIFQRHQLEYTAYGPLGQGEPHLRPFLDLRRTEHVALMERVAEEIHKLTWACEGTISGGHGEGLARCQFIRQQVGEELFAVFKSVKQLFDPAYLLNPDKKFSNEPRLISKNLKLGAGYAFSEGARPQPPSIDPVQAVNRTMFKSQTGTTNEMTVEHLARNAHALEGGQGAALRWAQGEMEAVCLRLNGYLLDRATGLETEVAPRFKYNRVEDAAPRAWVNIFRRLMTGRQRAGTFTSPELIRILNYCWNTELAGGDGPSRPNIDKLVLEAKARYYEGNDFPRDEAYFVNAETWCRVGRALAPLANTANALPLFRLLLEKVTGLARQRPIPHFKNLRLRHQNTFDPQGPRPKAVLYNDIFTRFFAPELAQAAVDVLEHNGYEVVVPEVPWTNYPAVASGLVVQVRRQAQAVCEVLAPWALRGYPILVLEPTDLLCLTRDYLYYTETPETRIVARHARDLCDFLLDLETRRGLKTDFQELKFRFGYHQPSHHRILRIGQPGLELVRLIPGVEIDFIDRGSSGMGVHFGLLKKYYEESLWLGRGLFKKLAQPAVRCGLTDSHYSALQMSHGSGKPALHPIQVLAAAYGMGVAKPRDYAYEPMDIPESDLHQERESVDEHEPHANENKKTVALRH